MEERSGETALLPARNDSPTYQPMVTRNSKAAWRSASRRTPKGTALLPTRNDSPTLQPMVTRNSKAAWRACALPAALKMVGLLALLAGASARAEDPVQITNLVSREYSIHVGGIQTPEIKEIVSREYSVFILNGPAEPYPQVISREFSVAIDAPGAPPPVTRLGVTTSPKGDRVDLNWARYEQWAVRDVARFDIYWSNRPFSSIAGMTPSFSVPAGDVGATLTNLPEFQDHFIAVVAVDALGNADPAVTYFGAYVLAPQVISREVTLFVGAEPDPPYRQVVSREFSIVVTTPQPPKPVGPVARTSSPTGDTVTLDWSEYNPWAELDVLRYDIYFSDHPFSSVVGMTALTKIPADQRFVTITNLPTFRDHFFAIVPVDAAENREPAVPSVGVYVLSPQTISREVSLFVGAEPDPPYRQVVSREISLVVADPEVPQPVTGVDKPFGGSASGSTPGAIDLNWNQYNEVAQRDVVRYRVYWDTNFFDSVADKKTFVYVADGTQQYTLSGLRGNGIYYVAVVAEDANGQFDPSVYSRSAQASTTIDPPSFKSQPISQTVHADGTATLSVTVEGTPPFTYRWYRNGYEVIGATGPSLTVPSAGASDAGAYTVEVEGVVGRIVSAPATLEVLIPPSIAAPPQPVTVVSGGAARFDIRVEGTPPFHFDWLFNGSPFGAPNQPELLRENLQAANSGRISVRVTNAVGSATSVEARLRVIDLVQIVKQPQGVTLPMNPPAPLQLSVGVTGTDPFEYQWRLNGQDLPNETNAVYSVAAAGLEDAGLYTVVVVNEAGAVTSDPAEVRLEVPSIPGNDTFAGATDLVGLTGPVSGANPAATHESGEPRHAGKPGRHSVWYRWTTLEAGQLRLRTVGSAFDTLLAVYTGNRVNELAEIASNDDAPDGAHFTSEVQFSARPGETYFVAVDGLGDDSGNYILSWQFDPGAPVLPRITLHPESQTQPPGASVVLRVTADNSTTIDWEFNGRPLAGVSGGTLTLDPLSPEKVGTYVAVVRGDGGAVRSHPAVVEIGPQVGARSHDKQAELDPLPAPAPRVSPQAEGGLGLLLSPGRPVEQWVNNEVNTTQLAEANHCGRLVRRTGWMLLEVERDGQLVITATNTAVPLVMALYSFSDPDQSLACAEGSRLVLPNAKAGRIYSLVFGSATDAGGLIELVCVSGVPPPPPSTPSPVTEVEPGLGVTLDAPLITGLEPAPKYQWYRNGREIKGANNATLILDSFAPELAGNYSVVLDNGVGRAEYAIGTLRADLPLTPLRPPEAANGVFTFHLSGNAGQRVVVEQGYEIGVWHTREEFWLPEGGQDYRDDAMAVRGRQLFRYAEVPLTMTEAPPLTDGRRTWRISGGRIGDRYVLEQSLNGTQWTSIRTNRVEEGDFLHVDLPGSPSSAQVRIQPGSSAVPF